MDRDRQAVAMPCCKKTKAPVDKERTAFGRPDALGASEFKRNFVERSEEPHAQRFEISLLQRR